MFFPPDAYDKIRSSLYLQTVFLYFRELLPLIEVPEGECRPAPHRNPSAAGKSKFRFQQAAFTAAHKPAADPNGPSDTFPHLKKISCRFHYTLIPADIQK